MRAAILLLSACTIGDESVAPPPPEIPPQVLTVDGHVFDYFVFQRVPEAAIATVGLAAEREATADDGGTYILIDVPASGLFRARVRPPGAQYLVTLDEEIELGEAASSHDLFAVAAADVERQHATAGLERAPGAGMVIVDLRDGAGAPLVGIAASALALVSPGDTRAPVFVGTLGDVDPALAASVSDGARARAAFLNVPPGDWTLRIDGGAAGATTVPIPVERDGVTLARAVVAPPPPPGPLGFVANVFPRLQRAIDGGAGCANCHVAGGVGEVLVYDGAAEDVYAAIMAAPGVVDTAAPDASLLVSKPLFEVPANHPNATWLSVSHPDYRLLRAWIEQGARP